MSKVKSLIRSMACAICRALGGEPAEQPPDVGPVAGSSPRTSKHTPSPAWLEGKMPTYEVEDLIKHLEFRITIHETYWGLVEDDPATWAAFGSVKFQQWAIEGYENAIFYLKRAT